MNGKAGCHALEGSFVPLVGVCSILGRFPCAAPQLGWALSSAVTWCVTLAHVCCWQHGPCSMSRLSVPAPLCTAGAGTICRSMGSWSSNPSHWYEQTLLPLQQWEWGGEHHVKKKFKKKKKPRGGSRVQSSTAQSVSCVTGC